MLPLRCLFPDRRSRRVTRCLPWRTSIALLQLRACRGTRSRSGASLGPSSPYSGAVAMSDTLREEFLHVPHVDHQSALIAWGAFFFETEPVKKNPVLREYE